ncbi:ABC transporter substrate-binding protein [Haloarcula sp. JP-L23]|uniref:ABC transporter substrate-binding protein n=1 Tax=Haloarcula sp. JP-L23 TaxID=2716717 RepID=UPI00140F13B1|nr:extracellular solute-binding protein [Haloarcula sp. JP-L23]
MPPHDNTGHDRAAETQRRSLSRRRLLELGSIAAATGLAGCGGGDGNDGGDGGDGDGGGQETASKIGYWNIHNGDDFREPINTIVSNFQESAGMTVNTRYVDNDDISEQLSSAVASDTLPNVGLLAIQTIQRLGADGTLSSESTTSVVDEVGEDDFRDGPLQFMGDGEGGYYGVPADAWVQGIWYRKSAFEEAGLEPPVTWDAILTAAETFHDPDNDTYGIGFGTQVDAYARQCFTQFARSNGAKVLDEDANVVFDSQEMVETLEYYQQLGQYTPGSVTFNDTRSLYGNQQEHMFLYSSYLLPDLLADEGEEMVADTGLAPATEKQRRSTYGQVLGHCIFDDSDAKLASSRNLVNHIMTGDSYVKWVHTQPGGTMPVLKSTSESEAYRDNETLSAWSDTINQISSALGNMDRFDVVNGTLVPEFGQISSQSLVAEAVNRVCIKGDDPQTVATEQAEKMRSALE